MLKSTKKKFAGTCRWRWTRWLVQCFGWCWQTDCLVWSIHHCQVSSAASCRPPWTESLCSSPPCSRSPQTTFTPNHIITTLHYSEVSCISEHKLTTSQNSEGRKIDEARPLDGAVLQFSFYALTMFIGRQEETSSHPYKPYSLPEQV